MTDAIAIAIVGMACCYPDADSPQELWENVLAKRRAFRRIPPERLNGADYISTSGAPDTTYVERAAVIEGFEFDRIKFRVTGDSFRSADLSHWLALDVADRALEDAGFLSGEGLPKEMTGVIVGNTLTGEFSRANAMRLRWPYVRRVVDNALGDAASEPHERAKFLHKLEQLYKAPFPPIGAESLAGGLSNTIAGRICNFFDLGGGGYTVDGACSSSLIAVANACTALSAGDLDVALVGGVDLSIDPFELVGFSSLEALAHDEMRVYDARPTGFLPGEGCGFVVLMREPDALAGGHRCWTRIAGWGVSSDGNGGLTRPKISGQRLAIDRAYKRAPFAIDAVELFEGHGTGTPIGDLVELRALAAARVVANSDSSQAAIGSIKANIGHTKAASGVAGLIKATMAVNSRILPPTTGVNQPNPIFADEARCLRVLNTAEPWPAGRPVCAGISSFGFGGINVHLALQERGLAPRVSMPPEVRRIASTPQDAELFLVAGLNIDELANKAKSLLAKARLLSQSELTDLAAALAEQANHGICRGAVIASTPDALHNGLAVLVEWLDAGERRRSDMDRGIFLGTSESSPRLAFLFPGQGTPIRFDGGALGRLFPEICNLYSRVGLEHPKNTVSNAAISTELGQPAIVTAEIAGLMALQSSGLTATAALGHSLGELVALYWAGAIDEIGTLGIARARGRAISNVHGSRGAMAILFAEESRVNALIHGAPSVEIAAVNGPVQTVVSGELSAIVSFIEHANSVDIATSFVPVEHAFHSKLMAPAEPGLRAHLQSLQFARTRKNLFSTITGGQLPVDCDYRRMLVDQLTKPVRFHDALMALLPDIDLCIEVGPGKVLAGLVKQVSSVPVVSLDVGADSLRGFLLAVGCAYSSGADVNASKLFCDRLTRPFALDRPLKFFTNPCSMQIETGKPDVTINDRLPEEIVSDAEPALGVVTAKNGQSILDSLREAVARCAELPQDVVADDSHLLRDLHLNSITVSQIVAEVARSRGLRVPSAPTEFADARLNEIANALEDLLNTGGSKLHDDGEPEGLDTWTRSFEMTWSEKPGLPKMGCIKGSGGWKVFGATDCAVKESLCYELDKLGGGGVVVCLSSMDGEGQIALLMDAAHVVLADKNKRRYFVVYHDGAGLGSFARTLYLENPDIVICVLELPDDNRAVKWALSEISSAQGFHEVRYDSDGKRFVPELSLLHPKSDKVSSLAQTDVLLVTGGGKGIAAECAMNIAMDTGAKLGLLGRSDPNEDAALAENLRRFYASGVKFQYVSADVADRIATKAAVAKITAALGPATAILHGAGVNRPALIQDLDNDQIIDTCSPKVYGLRNILAAINPPELRLLINFGSIIARSGMQGEAHYALANEWMTQETEMFQMANRHCRCLTLEWSIWSGVGMGERLGRVEALARDGITAIPPDQGIAILKDLLNSSAVGAVIIMGRVPDLPTLRLQRPALPLLRFVENPRVHFPGIELIVDADLSTGTDPYLDDHILDNNRLFPGVMSLEAMAQAAVAVTGLDRIPVFESIDFTRPIIVPDGQTETLRVLALIRESGVVDLAVRCSQTGFSIDHVRGRCRFSSLNTAPKRGKRPPKNPAPLPLNPDTDLYGPLLFHGDRFKRVRAYFHLTAHESDCEIGVDDEAHWFGNFLPQTLVLGDPAARDAVIHAVQACIPDARLLPVSIRQIIPGQSSGRGPWRAYAHERGCDGDNYDYDIDIYWANGELCEIWRGLRLRKIEPIQLKRWALPLLTAHLERGTQSLIPTTDMRVVLHNGVDAPHRANGGAVTAALLGDFDSNYRRVDGKPVTLHTRTNLSISHAEDVTLAVTGTGNVACDLEEVKTRSDAEWEDLLGPNYRDLAQAVSNEAVESTSTAATRIWATRECLKKSGALFDAPLTLCASGNNQWVLFDAAERRIATYVASINAIESPIAIAVLAERENARL